MTEYKFQVTIVPEDYDYNEEEIIYRIYFEDQLISERSLPVLQNNQGIVDTFNIQINEIKDFFKLNFFNLGKKLAKTYKIKINDLLIDLNDTNQTHGIKISTKFFNFIIHYL